MNQTVKHTIRIAALADIHVDQTSQNGHAVLFETISQDADILLLCGDLTNHGLPEEGKALQQDLLRCTIPVLAVLGNHDHESNQSEAVKQILREARVTLLEDEPFEFNTIGFAGVKRFGGGFGEYMLAAFGEPAIKDFVKGARDEAEKLEIDLANLRRVEKTIVALHYAPVAATCQGEPVELYPFLGSSLLEEVINRYTVSAVFHGHAHYGSPHGKTRTGIDVYNASYPLLQKLSPEKPYKIFEVKLL